MESEYYAMDFGQDPDSLWEWGVPKYPSLTETLRYAYRIGKSQGDTGKQQRFIIYKNQRPIGGFTIRNIYVQRKYDFSIQTYIDQTTWQGYNVYPNGYKKKLS